MVLDRAGTDEQAGGDLGVGQAVARHPGDLRFLGGELALGRHDAPRWYVPREDVDEEALTPVEGQTFCPYKGLCSYYDIGAARGAAWGYEDAWTEVRRISGMISFEPDKIEVALDGRRLRLDPGQSVISHGIDRDLTVEELSG